MKLIVDNDGLKRILQGLQRTLFATAVLLFGWCAFVVVDTWAFQQRESRHLDLLLASNQPAASALASSTVDIPSSAWPVALANDVIGRMDVPRLELTAIVVEGTSSSAMRRAVGHISGTALPGETGNVGISGHRDTFFRPLRHVQKEDLITLTTLRGQYRYRVISMQIVEPTDIEVLDPTTDEVLTLVTCYPFYYVGAAPERFIVRARRVH